MIGTMSLAERIAAFAKIINCCEITGREDSVRFDLESGLVDLSNRLAHLRKEGRRLVLIGNGGSAAIAAHSVTDFFNVAKVNATTLHESSLFTCMANDYGYENAFARMVAQTMQPGDMLIAISSSGKSLNIRNAAAEATKAGCSVVTLSGFAKDNALRSLGDMNIWLDSSDYGFVEVGHQFLLHYISDRFGAGLVE